MLLIDEKNLGTIPTSEIEALAASMLMENYIQVVDREMVRTNLKKQQNVLKMTGDRRGAAAAGLQFGADIVISGEAVAKPSATRIGGSNLRTYQAVTTLRAIRTDNARMLATSSETASVVALEDVSGSSKALKMAGGKALDKLITSMLKAWEGGDADASAASSIEIVVGGVDKIWKLKAVRDALRQRPDFVKKCYQKDFTSGVATFSVISDVTPSELAENMVLRPPEDLKIQVLQISQGKIALVAVAR